MRFFRASCLLIVLVSCTADAQELLPYLSRPVVLPNPALPTQDLTLRLYSNGCGVFEIGVVPTVEVEGSTVTATLWVIGPCSPSARQSYMDFPLGRFGPGNYTLEYRPFSSTAGNLPPEQTSFQVVDALPIPGASLPMLAAAGILILAFGMIHLPGTTRKHASSEGSGLG